MSHDGSRSHRPLRVLIGADTFPPDINGAARFARDHAVRLARRGHEVHVVAPATSMRTRSGIEIYDGQRIHVHRLRSVRWPLHDWLRFAPPWEVRRATRRLLRGVEPDVVHVQSFIDIGRGLAYETQREGIPLVATNHVMPDNVVEFSGLPRLLQPRLERFGWNLAQSVYSRADVVTSPTPIAARYLERQTALTGVMPISCGIDVDRFSPKTARPAGNRVLFVGRLDPEKNLDVLLTAFSLLGDDLRACLDLVGDGAERDRLADLADRLGVGDRVIFHGRVGDRELVALHALATVFVMPSTAELQSIATLEAMASATPVVLADAMALPHLIATGAEGHLAPAHSPRAFAERIERILRLDPEEYERMSSAALRTARSHDARAVTLRYEQLYRMPPRSRAVA